MLRHHFLLFSTVRRHVQEERLAPEQTERCYVKIREFDNIIGDSRVKLMSTSFLLSSNLVFAFHLYCVFVLSKSELGVSFNQSHWFISHFYFLNHLFFNYIFFIHYGDYLLRNVRRVYVTYRVHICLFIFACIFVY